jgi:hypothetical protein
MDVLLSEKVESGVENQNECNRDDQQADEEDPHELQAGATGGGVFLVNRPAFFIDRHGGYLLIHVGAC